MALTRHLLLFDIDGSAVSAGDLVLVVDLPPATQGVAYAGLLSATGGVAPYTFSETGTLPTGLSLDATTGELTGTPTALGYFEFTATVTDSAPTVKSKVVAIKVSSTIIGGGVLPPGEVGIAYSSGLSASGGTPPFTWSLLSGSLPGGLGPINSSTGIIAGTPTTPGVYNFTIRATDSASSTQDFPTSITVYAAVDLSTSTFPAGIVGVPYSAGPTTVGGVAPFTYSISSGAIPAGTTFSSSTGFVSGQPTTATTYTFHVTVLDTLGGTSTYNASVIITAGAGGAGVTSVNGATGVVTETSNDGSLGHTDTAGSGGNIDWTARLLAKLVTAAALPANTYANGTAGVGATLTGNATGTLTVDGVLVALNDFVLVTQEASGLKCGLYKCTTAGAVGVAYVLTRATRMDSAGKYVGAQVFITGGSTGAIRVYACSNQTAPTVGTTAITFNAITFASGVNGSFSNMSATILNGIVVAAANGISTTDIQIFSGSGTWTKPPNAKSVRVYMLGAGGGGGGGACTNNGGGNTFANPGGGGGACRDETFDPAGLTSTVAVTIGVGGTGATASATTSRNASTAGGSTTFGAFLTAFGGGGNPAGLAGGGNSPGSGAGSLQAGATSATVSSNAVAGRVGGTANTSGNPTLNYDASSPWGGAAGGSGAAANPAQRGGDASGGGPGGGAGGSMTATQGNAGADGGSSTNCLGGIAGTAGGTGSGNAGDGADGTNPTGIFGAGSAGGGGGSCKSGTAPVGVAGKGGKGGRAAGGGAGGGSGTNGNAKQGGDGGPGYCVVITLCSI